MSEAVDSPADLVTREVPRHDVLIGVGGLMILGSTSETLPPPTPSVQERFASYCADSSMDPELLTEDRRVDFAELTHSFLVKDVTEFMHQKYPDRIPPIIPQQLVLSKLERLYTHYSSESPDRVKRTLALKARAGFMANAEEHQRQLPEIKGISLLLKHFQRQNNYYTVLALADLKAAYGMAVREIAKFQIPRQQTDA